MNIRLIEPGLSRAWASAEKNSGEGKIFLGGKSSAPPWVGAERWKILAQNASQIAGNGTSKAYLPHLGAKRTNGDYILEQFIFFFNFG